MQRSKSAFGVMENSPEKIDNTNGLGVSSSELYETENNFERNLNDFLHIERNCITNGIPKTGEDYKLNNESKYLSFAPLSIEKNPLVETNMKPNVQNARQMTQESQEKYFSYKDSCTENLNIGACDQKDLSPINFVHDYKVETVHRKGKGAKNRTMNLQKVNQAGAAKNRSRGLGDKENSTKRSEKSLIHLRSKSRGNLAGSDNSTKNSKSNHRNPEQSELDA